MSWIRGLLVALFGAIFIPMAWGQAGLAVVRGTVQDTSKAVIPSAKVQLINTDTNIIRHVVSAPDGAYYFGAVPPGNYEAAVEANGFKKWVSRFVVEVGETADIEATLEI